MKVIKNLLFINEFSLRIIIISGSILYLNLKVLNKAFFYYYSEYNLFINYFKKYKITKIIDFK